VLIIVGRLCSYDRPCGLQSIIIIIIIIIIVTFFFFTKILKSAIFFNYFKKKVVNAYSIIYIFLTFIHALCLLDLSIYGIQLYMGYKITCFFFRLGNLRLF